MLRTRTCWRLIIFRKLCCPITRKLGGPGLTSLPGLPLCMTIRYNTSIILYSTQLYSIQSYILNFRLYCGSWVKIYGHIMFGFGKGLELAYGGVNQSVNRSSPGRRPHLSGGPRRLPAHHVCHANRMWQKLAPACGFRPQSYRSETLAWMTEGWWLRDDGDVN